MALTVTEQAGAELKRMLDNVDHEPEQVIRLVSGPLRNVSLALDTEKEGDQAVEHEGITVLVIESTLSERLSSAILDVKQTPEGPSLSLSA